MTKEKMLLLENQPHELKKRVVRPSISGATMESVKKWVSLRIEVNEESLGELVKDLYKDYVEFAEFEKLPKPEIVSRKSFPPALCYLLHVKGYMYVGFSEGRRGSFDGIQLKKHPYADHYQEFLNN